jgi:hypothetical protein
MSARLVVRPAAIMAGVAVLAAVSACGSAAPTSSAPSPAVPSLTPGAYSLTLGFSTPTPTPGGAFACLSVGSDAPDSIALDVGLKQVEQGWEATLSNHDGGDLRLLLQAAAGAITGAIAGKATNDAGTAAVMAGAAEGDNVGLHGTPAGGGAAGSVDGQIVLLSPASGASRSCSAGASVWSLVPQR